MLKNHYRCLNFIPRDVHHVIDIWTDTNPDGDPLPKGIPEMLQGIYHKHSWPDVNKYRKNRLLSEGRAGIERKVSRTLGILSVINKIRNDRRYARETNCEECTYVVDGYDLIALVLVLPLQPEECGWRKADILGHDRQIANT
jgi:hypothetical protein